MKKLFLVLLLIPFFLFGQKKDKPAEPFTIIGELKNIADANYINMNYFADGVQYSETAQVKNGKYSVSGKTFSTQLVMLTISYKEKQASQASSDVDEEKKMISLFIQPGKIQVTSVNTFSNIIVKGAKWHNDYVAYVKETEEYNNNVLSLFHAFPDYSEGLTKERRLEFIEKKNKLDSIVINTAFIPFIKKYSTSPVAVMALKYYSTLEKDPEKINALFELLPAQNKNTEDGEFAANKIAGLRRTQTGKHAPEFTLPDSTGKMISLSSYHGKYLLLDFTKSPSGCPPCKEELPFMASAYLKYNERGFEILSVDLAMKKYGIKESVKDFKKYKQITWNIVFDFLDDGLEKMVFTQYGIQSTPTMFLIDPQGKILAKEDELRGNELDKTLEKFIK